MNTAFGVCPLHWTNGGVWGILSTILVVIAALSRSGRNVVYAVVILVAGIVPAFAGTAFVNTTPNPPTAFITMGLGFLVAFGAAMACMFRFMRARRAVSPPPDSPTGA